MANLFASLLALPLPRRIIDVIAAAGGEARFVGGVVRDSLLGADASCFEDIDMATTLLPDQASQVLKQAGLRVVPTGIDHGTVTVFNPAEPMPVVELTTLRQDIRTDGRHAEVQFGTDWREDAQRRDFTINAMYLRRDGDVFDPFNGRGDLAVGKVRFVGTPRQRIAEDYLRILRFFRFQARFGKEAPDAEAMAAITELAPHLDRVSGERIAQEIFGILRTRSAPGLAALIHAGVDRVITAPGFHLNGYDQLLALDPAVDLMTCLSYLLEDGAAAAVGDRLRLSRRQQRYLGYMEEPVDGASLEGADWQQAAWWQLKQHQAEPAELACRYARRALKEQGRLDVLAYARLKRWTCPELPVRGQDIRDQGVPTGMAIGRMLAHLEQAWVASGFRLSRAEMLKMLDGLQPKG